jgi:hypothetical protein
LQKKKKISADNLLVFISSGDASKFQVAERCDVATMIRLVKLNIQIGLPAGKKSYFCVRTRGISHRNAARTASPRQSGGAAELVKTGVKGFSKNLAAISNFQAP